MQTFLLPMLLLTCLSACQPNLEQTPTETLPESLTTLRVGTLYGPQIYMNNGQEITGFDYEMAAKFAEYLDIPLEMTPYANLPELYQALETNQIDIIAAGMTDTGSRRLNYRLSPPLYEVDQVLVYRQGDKAIDNIDKLAGQIVVVADSAYEETLVELQNDNPQLNWQATNSQDIEELLQLIADETIDYTIADSSALQINRRFLPELRAGPVLKSEQNIVWLLRPKGSDALMAKLLAFWDQEQSSGTLARLQERYFGHVERFDYVDTRAFIRAVDSKLPLYRPLFEKYSGELDWRKLAATAYQESHWNPRARSPTGVRGMMMLTLPTAKQMGIENRLDAEQSIQGGAKYLSNILDRLPDSIPEDQRMWFALASYNIGMGHVEDARKLAESMDLNPSAWSDVKHVLPLLQKRQYYSKTRYGYARGTEAAHYVDNIRRYYDTLIWLDTQQALKLEQEQQAETAATLSENPLPPLPASNPELIAPDQ
ncbi:membrane-bound lytic murein transglycosylase MltF [Shewanella sp. NIFS-20-20]|uniref:membrane-bound lytic murein transglycosylase MltF n=1 Tax=Shewanella sp. NIFS-20-20 TaxID=2853806 RepID=UPI001C44D632|nr:membrane-bound lytic murein transglycosylase MltF [Shewanella sp. NIFS-20-20]MBV7317140.1 membrane-bound lytic murein transglycosylase MltF [Shewanella sp. NIFS-20-20]